MIDTGAPDITLDPEFAREIGLRITGGYAGTFAGGRTAELRDARVDAVRAGTVTVRDVTATIFPSRALALYQHERIDGVIGTVFLSRFIARIDYPNHRLVLFPRGVRVASTRGVDDRAVLAARRSLHLRARIDQRARRSAVPARLGRRGRGVHAGMLDDRRGARSYDAGARRVRHGRRRRRARDPGHRESSLPGDGVSARRAGLYTPSGSPLSSFPFRTAGIVSHEFLAPVRRDVRLRRDARHRELSARGRRRSGHGAKESASTKFIRSCALHDRVRVRLALGRPARRRGMREPTPAAATTPAPCITPAISTRAKALYTAAVRANPRDADRRAGLARIDLYENGSTPRAAMRRRRSRSTQTTPSRRACRHGARTPANRGERARDRAAGERRVDPVREDRSAAAAPRSHERTCGEHGARHRRAGHRARSGFCSEIGLTRHRWTYGHVRGRPDRAGARSARGTVERGPIVVHDVDAAVLPSRELDLQRRAHRRHDRDGVSLAVHGDDRLPERSFDPDAARVRRRPSRRRPSSRACGSSATTSCSRTGR